MDRVQAVGRWVGGLSSAGFAGGSYAAMGMAALLLSRAAADATDVGMMAVVSVYCWLRPTRRGEVFRSWVAPGPLIMFTGSSIFGIPMAYVAAPIAVLVVAILAYEDRAERRAAQA